MIRSILLFAFTFYIATSIVAAEPISVRDFGAVGDNIADDTSSIVSAARFLGGLQLTNQGPG